MTPAWGPIGREVYERTYQRREDADWAATVDRVVQGNLALVDERFIEPGEAASLRSLLLTFKALPAGRHLWASGADTSLGLFNCHRAGWTSQLADHFVYTFDQLMLGGGVGANYSQNYLDLAPVVGNELQLVTLMAPSASVDITVPDSREGWVEALRSVIEAHTSGVSSLTLDLSEVRPAGALIHGFGGTASGPGPLVTMLHLVNDLLNGLVGSRLSPLDAMTIDHAVASCVVAGNVRRSARMSILHWADPSIFDFITCKADPSAHWSTNISVEVDDEFFLALDNDDPHAIEVLNRTTAGIYANGEPGFYNSSMASEGEHGDVRATNPCGEIALEEWEQCCLGHVNLAAFHDDQPGAREAFRLMARYLVRATFGKSSDPRQEEVKNRNRRIGVGFFGFNDWAALQGIRFSDIPSSYSLVEQLASYSLMARSASAEYALELGIPAPIKCTTVAPTGSVAKLPGVSEGIQPPYSRYFLRRVRYSATDPKLLGLSWPQEPCIYTDNTTVVSFIAHDPLVERVAPELIQQSDEVSLVAYLEVQSLVQRVWADNAVSITANFNRDATSPSELAILLQKHLPTIKGWTGMPEDGRPQSPYERLTLDTYQSISAGGSSSAFQAMDDCSTGACPVR